MVVRFFYVLFFVLLLVCTAQAQDKFCRVWLTEERESKVEIYLTADGSYGGKIVWLKNGSQNGKPLTDDKNPDVSKRGKPWIGLQIITGLMRKSGNELVGGKIYDPRHGNFYSCKVSINSKGELELRGYVLGMPFLGKTTTWYPVEEPRKPEPKPQAEPAVTQPAKTL